MRVLCENAPKQSPQLWAMFQAVTLLPEDVRFLWKFLWKKLPVQVLVVGAFPSAGCACPLNGAKETHYQ